MNGITYRPYRGTEELAGMAAASARLRTTRSATYRKPFEPGGTADEHRG